MLKAWGQEDTALSLEEATSGESRASRHLVSSAGLGLLALRPVPQPPLCPAWQGVGPAGCTF